ncbi:FHA domain-containing protein [Butyrivibrio sp. MC2013]|uniref:FHA domain-containing protein n=1 Tax=Butyrivibrio sp. MC2013 TaxID=1280686 RepID=UPI0003F5A0A5|nr:FHA domain-containing protein [Butyrivibrio sp. MC2013]
MAGIIKKFMDKLKSGDDARCGKANNTSNEYQGASSITAPLDSDEDVGTDAAMRGNEGSREGHDTVFLFAAPEVLELRDLDRPDKSFMASLKQPVIIGSGSDCDIRIGYDETVSRRHCCIYEKDSRIYVENLSSVNMTLACGQEATDPVMVYNKSELCLGRVRMELAFH